MTPKGYLLDLHTLAEALRRSPSLAFVERLRTSKTSDRWTSVITVSQLMKAAHRLRQPRLIQDLARLVASVRVAPIDLAAAQTFAKLRASLPNRGGRQETEEILFAATALSLNLVVVTKHPEKFSHYPNLEVQDWTVGRS